MSLSNIYVLADDGRWYINGTIGEAPFWYICFDDDDPAELVIRKQVDPLTKKFELFATPTGLITRYKLPFEIPNKPYAGKSGGYSRMFPNAQRQFKLCKPAAAYWLKQTGPIPTKLLLRQGHGRAYHPRGGCCIYGNEEEIIKWGKKER